MKTMLELDEGLLARAEELAHLQGRTVADVVEDGLRKVLPRKDEQVAEPASLPSFPRGGLLPGVNLDDSAGLLDVMEGVHDPS